MGKVRDIRGCQSGHMTFKGQAMVDSVVILLIQSRILRSITLI